MGWAVELQAEGRKESTYCMKWLFCCRCRGRCLACISYKTAQHHQEVIIDPSLPMRKKRLREAKSFNWGYSAPKFKTS